MTTKIKIVPLNEAPSYFKMWWQNIGCHINSKEELASLAFDEGHSLHHKEVNYDIMPTID